MSLNLPALAIVGGTLIDGTGRPPLYDSVVLIEKNRITAVDKTGELEIPQGVEVIDASGSTVIPGLIDAHLHFLGEGIRMIRSVDLSKTKSIQDALEMVKKRIEGVDNGSWVLGRGWDDSKWDEKRFITKFDLDPISPKNPVVLTRVCGHMITLNTNAMNIANITPSTKDPPGGKVDKDSNGEPTGVIRDAEHLIDPFIPPVTEELALKGLQLINEHALKLGCTGIHDAEINTQEIKTYLKALQLELLKVRVNIMWKSEEIDTLELEGLRPSTGDEKLRIGPAKIIFDGSLGARTATLYEPYDDDPNSKGLTLMTEEDLDEQTQKIHGKGYQLAIHAIGDHAIDMVINAIEAAIRSSPRKDHRHRIEHCELLSTNQIERLQRLGIIASMQPNFVGEWSIPEGLYEVRLGKKRLRQNNPYRLLLDEEVKIAFGSDGMPFNPIYGIHSAVNHPIKESRITIEEAIKAFTLDAAYASFEENIKGSVELGKLADIVILNSDITKVPMEDIKGVSIRMTMIDGEILYQADNSDTA